MLEYSTNSLFKAYYTFLISCSVFKRKRYDVSPAWHAAHIIIPCVWQTDLKSAASTPVAAGLTPQ